MAGGHVAPSGRRKIWVAVLAAMLLAGVLGFVLLRAATEGEGPADDVQPAGESQQMPLTGMPTEVVPHRPALIVKVSNSPEARPQTGLADADVVFEEVTEGGVTRFLAVFHSQLVEVVGPVRSARPVDAQLIAGFDHPGFAYSGARDEVRAMLTRTPAVAITEGAPGFFRDHGTYASHPVAPHNLFLELQPAWEAVTDAGARPLTGIGWEFDDESPSASVVSGTSVEIPMSAAFTTSWEYDASAERYRRSQNGRPSELTGPDRIGAANVVVLDTDHYVGASGYPETNVLGSGSARILRDGQLFAARWSKPRETDPLALLLPDASGPFPLKPGPTWIHLADELPG
jgi:hypothetical protein